MLVIPKCQNNAVCFVDVLRVLFLRRLPRNIYRLLRKNCAKLRKRRGEYFGFVYSLWRPNRRSIGILDRYFRRNRDYITYVEISLDFPTESFDDALDAAKFFRRHAWHRFSREYTVVDYESLYSKRRGARKAIFAGYPTFFSKVLHKPALHVEWRLKSARVAKRAGITRPRSLLVINIRDFWQKRWCFLDFEDESVLHAAQIVARRKNQSVERITKLIHINITCDIDGTLSAADFRRSCLRMRLQPGRFVRPVKVRFPRKFRWVLAEGNP